MQAKSLITIIPCYNEASRIDVQAFLSFLENNKDTHLLFVNDGSTDNTSNILKKINDTYPLQTSVISLKKNKGKGIAVRAGVLTIIENKNYDYIGYLDSDLSTHFADYLMIFQALEENGAAYAFGSRIKTKNSFIIRKPWRHVVGRALTSVIDIKLKLGIYDTQCGAKVFKTTLAEKIFAADFHTRWLFDVELFARIRKDFPAAAGLEVPLKKWGEKGGSKINLLSAGIVLKDVFNIYRNYK